ncbi:MAG: glycosyltransferase [Acidimicrobiia bacterium]|nr:glycosyltransferase [Acidimicrobiia bacterium]
MKILHLVASLGSGGAEKQLWLLCRETQGRVSHHVLALASGGCWEEPLRKAGAEVVVAGHGRVGNRRVIGGIRNAIKQAMPDIVQCWLPSVNIAGALAAHLVPGWNGAVIASVRNVDSWKPAHYRFLERLVAPLWDAVIANSHAGAANTKASGVEGHKVHVVPNGIPFRPIATPAEISRTRRELNIAEDAFLISTASRLVAQKRVDRILRIASAVAPIVPQAVFLIAGDGAQRPALEALAAERNLGERVRFLGELADVGPLLAASDVFLLCSEREGMSNSLLEAMQAGCVPLVTDAGDNRVILSKVPTGLVAPPEQMPAALLHWSRYPLLFQTMRRRAREGASHYTVQAMAAQTLEVYGQLLSEKGMEPVYENA